MRKMKRLAKTLELQSGSIGSIGWKRPASLAKIVYKTYVEDDEEKWTAGADEAARPV